MGFLTVRHRVVALLLGLDAPGVAEGHQCECGPMSPGASLAAIRSSLAAGGGLEFGPDLCTCGDFDGIFECRCDSYRVICCHIIVSHSR